MILPNKPVSVLINNSDIRIWVQPRSYMGAHIYLFGCWEKEVSEYVLKLPKKKLIIDIGAHIGYYTTLFTKILNEKGKIVAFEPNISAIELLKINTKPFKETICIEKYAISDSNRLIRIKGDKVVSFGEDYDFSIEASTLDHYFEAQSFDINCLVKIDIEGYELLALKGMKNLLISYKPDLLIEVHPQLLKNYKQDESDIFNFLKDLNYTFHVVNIESVENYTVHFFNNERINSIEV